MNTSDGERKLQTDLDAVALWCEKWGLTLNPEKCLFLHHSAQGLRHPMNPMYKINSHTLKREKQAKDLGVIITDDLKINTHIDTVNKKFNSEIGRIKRAFKCTKHKFISDIYTSYVDRK